MTPEELIDHFVCENKNGEHLHKFDYVALRSSNNFQYFVETGQVIFENVGNKHEFLKLGLALLNHGNWRLNIIGLAVAYNETSAELLDAIWLRAIKGSGIIPQLLAFLSIFDSDYVRVASIVRAQLSSEIMENDGLLDLLLYESANQTSSQKNNKRIFNSWQDKFKGSIMSEDINEAE